MQATEKIWMNGELVDWDDARIHVGVHGLHYGSGVFEGIRCYDTPKGPAVFRLTDHMQRLRNSARLIHMDDSVQRSRSSRTACNDLLERERARGVLHPADRVLRLRPARRLGARQPGRDGDHVVAVGHLPRRGGAPPRDPDEDLELAADAGQRHPARVEGHRRLPQLDARRRPRLSAPATTRRSCSRRTATSRTARARRSSSSRGGEGLHARPLHRDPARDHARLDHPDRRRSRLRGAREER